jgi:hypothetical protein
LKPAQAGLVSFVLTFYKQFPKDLSSLNKTITVHLQYFALFLDQQTKEERPKEN